jgi:predicted RNA-binding protein
MSTLICTGGVMAYYLDLFSPETYEAFSRSSRDVSGFRLRQESIASRIQIGDKFICYMTKLSRWIGVLEVMSLYYKDDTPIFLTNNDPFVVRFTVKPVAWLEKERAVPIRDDEVWSTLSFTKGIEKTSAVWTGKVRASLSQIQQRDGQFLEKLIVAQINNGKLYEVNERDYQKFVTHTV